MEQSVKPRPTTPADRRPDCVAPMAHNNVRVSRRTPDGPHTVHFDLLAEVSFLQLRRLAG
jgi:hypothetical protein